jgi:hypothetical protein
VEDLGSTVGEEEVEIARVRTQPCSAATSSRVPGDPNSVASMTRAEGDSPMQPVREFRPGRRQESVVLSFRSGGATITRFPGKLQGA